MAVALHPDVAAFPKAPIEPVFDKSNPVAVGPETEIHIKLSDQDVDDLIEFLRELTDPARSPAPRPPAPASRPAPEPARRGCGRAPAR